MGSTAALYHLSYRGAPGHREARWELRDHNGTVLEAGHWRANPARAVREMRGYVDRDPDPHALEALQATG